MAIAKTLTELESCTLGVILHNQPCSTYEVRRVFARSPTPEWSASAGTIYPVIERLARLQLVRAVQRPGDSRGRRDLTVTPKGERAVQRWFLAIEDWVAHPTPDPIRTRVYFLASLESRRDRAKFLTQAEALTRKALRELRAHARAERTTSEADYLASVGSILQLDARLKWLKAVRRRTT